MPQFKFLKLFFFFFFQKMNPNDSWQLFTEICRLTSTIITVAAKRTKPVALCVMFFARAKLHRQFPRALTFVCYVAMNTRTNYHITVFTLNKACARNVWDFTQHDEALTFSTLSVFSFGRPLFFIANFVLVISVHPRDEHQTTNL